MKHKLTVQQEAIVSHGKGPALVFAVAGSGKTTSMINRIERLVRQGIHPANKILATSFGKATVNDIRAALSKIGVRGVKALTLHALGFTIIQKASERGYISPDYVNLQDNVEFLNDALVRKAVRQLSRQLKVQKEDLNLDTEDLKNQISAWKGNLFYPDIDRLILPPSAMKMVQQAEHPNQYYVRVFDLYERERERNKWLTFDDMLLTAWELMMIHEDILSETRARFETVMVDEFQDVNKVQYLMVDQITHPHRNYMAIGDDDQCIYEWRGARPDFILSFQEVYGAKVYYINDNFRSTGHQLLLANEVIQHNKNRYPKKLSLTKGFEGNSFILKAQNGQQEAHAIVNEISNKLADGRNAGDVAILIRLYAQTPFLEAELIRKNIKYHVVGNLPFYRRHEVTCLIKYLRFALVEREVLSDKGYPKKLSDRKRYLDDFKTILINPQKYLSQAITEEICRRSQQHQSSVLEELVNYSGQLHPRVQDRIDTFLEDMETLIERIDEPAVNILTWLADKIGYKGHLIKENGISEMGELKWEVIQSFIAFTKEFGNSEQLLQAIYRIGQGYKNFDKEPEEDWLKIMTVYRAKGLEWNTVFIPGCNQGVFPYLREGEEDMRSLEAERRLFYVGLTRAKQNLYLSYEDGAVISQFLLEVNSQEIIQDAYELRDILRHPTPQIISKGLLRKLESVAFKYPLGKYFREWFPNGIQLNLDFPEEV